MLTPSQLSAWRALCEKATEGPWMHVNHGNYIEANHEPNEPIVLRGDEEHFADLAFAATARTALPRLLDEVERLRAVYNAALPLIELIQTQESPDGERLRKANFIELSRLDTAMRACTPTPEPPQ